MLASKTPGSLMLVQPWGKLITSFYRRGNRFRGVCLMSQRERHDLYSKVNRSVSFPCC